MKRFRTMLPAAVALVTGIPLYAQTFTVSPAGVQQYTDTYTGGGGWSCDPTFTGFATGSCQATGNSIMFTNNGATLTITYMPNSGPITAENVPQRITFGAMEVALGGTGDFIFPTLNVPWRELFSFRMSLRSTVTTSGGGFSNYFFRTTDTEIVGPGAQGNSGFFVPIVSDPQPAGLAVAYTVDNLVFDASHNNTFAVTGTFGIVPEPSTIILMATGLLGVFAITRRRRTA